MLPEEDDTLLEPGTGRCLWAAGNGKDGGDARVVTLKA